MRVRREPLATRVARQWPAWDATAVDGAIRGGELVVEGRVLTNPRAQVPVDAPVRHEPPADLAGRRKLAWALERFDVQATGATVLDVGACTGGFTTAWLEAGAARVYAVDVGHGQLLGSLRQDARVVNLERTNVAVLDRSLVPERLDAISVDVSYLALGAAVVQLGHLDLAPGADLLGLVKPMFELRLATIPTDRNTLERARDGAVSAITSAGWALVAVDECPIRGAKGAVEYVVHAREASG
jgi:23S rRNA (cytidine1920-2'-O)/16S rRNA (cytidine1409-2'-O)-methyltransferase